MAELSTTIALEVAEMAMISVMQISKVAVISKEFQGRAQPSLDLAIMAMKLAASNIYSELIYQPPPPKINGKKHDFHRVGALPSGFRIIGGIDEVLGNSEPPGANSELADNRSQQANRCKALLLEILRRAAHDWVLYRQHKKMAMREIASDAYIWLFEENEKHPNWKARYESSVTCDGEEIEGVKTITSFLAVCEALELDPKTVRARVKKMNIHMIISAGRPAETRKYRHSEGSIPPEECRVFTDINECPEVPDEDEESYIDKSSNLISSNFLELGIVL